MLLGRGCPVLGTVPTLPWRPGRV